MSKSIRKQRELHFALEQAKIQALNFGYEFIRNATVRAEYIEAIKTMSDDVMLAYRRGFLTGEEAAGLAREMRNVIMEHGRARQTRLGRAYSTSIKAQGRQLDELLNKHSRTRFKKTFDQLGELQREEVFLDVVTSSGRNQRAATSTANKLRWGGRVLWLFTAGVAIYNVGTAENKVWQAGLEGSSLGGGFAGGAAGGAAAGVWFGPVGIGVGVVVGGVLGTLISEEAYLAIAGPEREEARTIISRNSGLLHMDERRIAKELYFEFGINMDWVYIVFVELDDNYNGDSDDVARVYVNLVWNGGGSKYRALAKNKPL